MSAQRRAGRSAADQAKKKRERELKQKRESTEAHIATLNEQLARHQQAIQVTQSALMQMQGRLRLILEDLGEVPPLADPVPPPAGPAPEEEVVDPDEEPFAG